MLAHVRVDLTPSLRRPQRAVPFGLGGLAALAVLLVSSGAMAGGRSDITAAEALFREARADAKRGDHTSACPKFRESYRLDPTIGTLLNVADCDERDHHLLQALERFEDGLRRLPASDDRNAYVRSRARALESRVAEIRVRPIPGQTAHVTLDDHELAFDKKTRVEPGQHQLRVQLARGESQTQAITVSEGERRDIDLAELTPRSNATPSSQPTTPPRPLVSSSFTTTKPAAIVVGGLGLASLVTSGILVKLMFDAKSTADQHCDQSTCDPIGLDATANGKLYGSVGAVTFAAGAVSVGLATYLFMRGGPRRDDRSARVSPFVTVSGGGLAFGGRL